MNRHRSALSRLVLVASLVAVAACGSGDDEQTADDVGTTDVSASAAPAVETPVTEAPVTEPPITEAPAEPAAGADWERVAAPADCMCADGSPYSWFVREADPTKVLFFLEGGGACFTGDMCAPGSETYKQMVGSGVADSPTGIFDLANPDNPFADWSMVFVPYCTGDVHAGNLTKDYGNGIVIEHKGFVNASAALNDTVARFAEAGTVVVAGSSAGAFPTPIFGGLIGDLLPNAGVKVIADSGGAIPDAMSAVVGNWGTIESLPDWPEFEGVSPADFNPPFTFAAAARHNPEITFARHDYAFDDVLSSFARMAGLSPDDLVNVMKDGETRIEQAGTAVASWIGPGDAHTILGRDEMYDEEMNGVRFIDWLRAFLDGTPLADNYCVDCAG